jgi:hypothetical protein
MTPLHVAIALALLCGVGAWQVTVIPESLMQMTVGPTLVPAAVVAGLSAAARPMKAMAKTSQLCRVPPPGCSACWAVVWPLWP